MSEQPNGANPAPQGGPWYGDIPADKGDLKTWVEGKQFANPIAALESYRNAETLLGAPAEQILRIPKEDDAEGLAKFHNRLGRPEKPEEYGLEVPEGDDGNFARHMSGFMHKLGVSKNVAQQLAKEVNRLSAEGKAAQEQQDATNKATRDAAFAALKTKLGPQYDATRAGAERAIRAFAGKAELSAEEADQYVGLLDKAPVFFRFISAAMQGLGEERFVSGDGGHQFTLSAAAAKGKLDELREKRLKGEIGEKDFLAESERLGKIANPG